MAKKIPLIAGHFYHIYNRGNNRQSIFIEQENYNYFLYLGKKHISSIAKVYAYALLPDHFHLLVQIKKEEALREQDIETPRQVSQKFGNWFNAYAKAFNKKYDQVSSLFQDRFQRNLIDSEEYLFRCIQYLHWNPQKHNYVDHFTSWPNTSYFSLISDQTTHLERTKVINWFGGRNEFVKSHENWLLKKQEDWKFSE